MFILIELIIMNKGNNICKAQCLGHNKCSVSIFPFLLPSLHDSFSFFFSHRDVKLKHKDYSFIFLKLTNKGSYLNDIK